MSSVRKSNAALNASGRVILDDCQLESCVNIDDNNARPDINDM